MFWGCFLSVLGKFWDVWGVFGRCLGCVFWNVWEVFGGSLGGLRAILAQLGPMNQHDTKKHGFLNPPLAPLGAILGTSFHICSLKIRLMSVFVEFFLWAVFRRSWYETSKVFEEVDLRFLNEVTLVLLIFHFSKNLYLDRVWFNLVSILVPFWFKLAPSWAILGT